ncbi:MAG: hypothetical protein J6386_08025 [Candidatus Synoicihabitans palmerolidicus]|nr:hypothetical protein [Candidatus Synoicihabitans palmerolidicus]
MIGALLVGYIIGNRGFAQFMLVPGLPLLPGEMGLVILAGLQVIERATAGPERRRLAFFDVLILTWIVIGSDRFLFDCSAYRFLALRDFAMVYYATFFFLAQTLVRQRPEICVRLLTLTRRACVVMLVTHRLTLFFPGFFFAVLQFRGTPLIFYKADLAGMFLALGTVLQYLRFEEKGG